MFCAYTRPRCQVSVCRAIGPLVSTCIVITGVLLGPDKREKGLLSTGELGRSDFR